MNILLILPIITPFFTAICCLFFWRYPKVQRVLTAAGAVALVVISLCLLFSIDRHGIQSTQIGNWPAPFGITIVADLFSSIMVVMAGMINSSAACLFVERQECQGIQQMGPSPWAGTSGGPQESADKSTKHVPLVGCAPILS